MHILTKILVVFAAVLSVFLAALTIAYAANQDRIAQSLAGEQALREQARAALDTQVAQAKTQQVESKAQIDKLSGEIAQREAEKNQLQTENARLLSEKNKAETARQSIESKIAELGELAKTQASMISSYRSEVTTLRDNEIDYRKKSLDLEARLSDLESQREVLTQTTRALQEQLAEAKLAQESSLKSGGSGLSMSKGADAGVFVPQTPIQGRIEKTMLDPASKAKLAQINVGSNDQVRENMKLAIVRDNNFVANLIIVQTDLKWSVGRIENINQRLATDGKPVEVRSGDLVLSVIK